MRTGERQSFAARVREELIRLPAGKPCCMLSEISAFTQTSGHLAFRGGGWLSVSYRLEDAGAARRLFQLLKKRLSVNPTLHFTQTSRLGGRRTCVLTLSGEDARTLLNALHMTETDENGHPPPFTLVFRSNGTCRPFKVRALTEEEDYLDVTVDMIGKAKIEGYGDDD